MYTDSVSCDNVPEQSRSIFNLLSFCWCRSPRRPCAAAPPAGARLARLLLSVRRRVEREGEHGRGRCDIKAPMAWCPVSRCEILHHSVGGYPPFSIHLWTLTAQPYSQGSSSE